MVDQRKFDRNHGRQDVRYILRRFFAGKQRCPWFEKMLIDAGYRQDKKLLQSMNKMKSICAEIRVRVVKGQPAPKTKPSMLSQFNKVGLKTKPSMLSQFNKVGLKSGPVLYFRAAEKKRQKFASSMEGQSYG